MLYVRLTVLVALLVLVGVGPITAAENDSSYTEVEVLFTNEDVTLAGTLSLPITEGPHPTVILISGSGPSNRDEAVPEMMAMAPFALLADGLASEGFAVLRYDDRGVGESTGEYELATSADFATDAAAAVAYLKTREEIDADRIGLLGHSEGGMIAAQVAAELADVAFVITMGGPAVSGYDLLLLQMELTMRASGAPEAAIEALIAEEQPVMDMIVAEEWSELEAVMREVLPQQLAMMSEAEREAIGDPELLIERSMQQYRTWFHYFLTYDPAEAWRRVEVPVLALYGELDTQVDAEQNVPALEAALTEAENQDYTIVRFPHGNHVFQEAETGSPDEYPTLEQTFLPEFVPTIVAWLQRVA